MKTKTPYTVLMATAVTLASANAQEKGADPYVAPAKSAPAAVESSDHPKTISICYEDFSVPLAMAVSLQRAKLDNKTIYKKLVESLGKDDVKQETFVVLRGRSGQKGTVECIHEMIYPTDYEPPKLPTTVTGQDNGLVAPALPTAFETRNVGFTLEIKPTLSDDSTLLELNLLPEHVDYVGRSKHGQGASETEMPVFESQRNTTQVRTRLDEPFLLGTINRPPSSKVDPNSANRIWFAFITASIPK